MSPNMSFGGTERRNHQAFTPKRNTLKSRNRKIYHVENFQTKSETPLKKIDTAEQIQCLEQVKRMDEIGGQISPVTSSFTTSQQFNKKMSVKK